MSDRTIYTWLNKKVGGYYLVHYDENPDIWIHTYDLFHQGKPFKEAAKDYHWKANPNFPKEFEQEKAKYARTLEWIEKPTPLFFYSRLPKERLERFDILAPECSWGGGVVNQKALDILQEHAAEAIEIFDANIRTPTGELSNYKCFSICKELSPDCVDEEKSVIWQKSDNYRSYKRLIFKPGCMEPHHLRMFYYDVVISKTLVDAFKKNKIRGLVCHVLEDFNNGLWNI